MSRESTNKQLMAWQRQGLLDVIKGGVIVKDDGALADRAGSLEG